jgi:hypothetical protein
MLALNEYVEDANAHMGTFNEESMLELSEILEEIDPIFANILKQFDEFLEKHGDRDAIQDTKGGKPPLVIDTRDEEEHYSWEYIPRQHGGRVYPGESYLVGEVAPELFRPDVSGTIIPSDPWGEEVVSPFASDGDKVHIVLKVGDETLIDRILDRVDQEIVL